MPSTDLIDAASAEARLMRYLAIDGVSGEEKKIAEAIAADLKKLGVPAKAIRFDDANKRIPLPTQTGNLFVTLPGTVKGKRLLFATHLDTVPLCKGAKPVKKGRRIDSAGKTALGGDNRTGCAVLVTLVESLYKKKLPHPPITLLFTVREESGLQGSHYLDKKFLDGAAMCFNVDSKVPADFVTGAVGAERFDVEIEGKAAHAGVAPEKGISSTMVLSMALAEARKGGWFGKVVKGKKTGTSNVGVVAGRDHVSAAGDATNVVTDFVYARGETRSSDVTFAATITKAYKTAFEKAVKAVKDDKGGTATLRFESVKQYPSFRLDDKDPAVVRAKKAATSIGLKPSTNFSNGGLDANWFAQYGVPTVTIGAGQHEIHTVNEWIDLDQFDDGCRLAVALATVEE
ncbi:MAG: M20/M25/M40 family metallo-hydrolase [Phycisphaerae bacterium]|nr:M20/M25/M40 family metallo-hydrolase [Phycisphaerae bacterium]